jgi:hypothetical protein
VGCGECEIVKVVSGGGRWKQVEAKREELKVPFWTPIAMESLYTPFISIKK